MARPQDHRGDYVVALHVPVWLDGGETLVATDWARALVLLRDSLSGHFDRLVVVAPSLPMTVAAEQPLEPTRERLGDVVFRPSMDLRGRARHYWLRDRRRWLTDVGAALEGAAAAHLGMSNLYRPINYDAFRAACRRPLTTIMIRDTDEIAKREGLVRAGVSSDGPVDRLHWWLYDRAMRGAARRVDLLMLKGPDLMARYGSYAREARMFENTAYLRAEIVPEAVTAPRVQEMLGGRPLRLVYCGRFEERKGVDQALRILARARTLGADCRLELIGDGPGRAALEAQAGAAGLLGDGAPGEAAVRFLGSRPYGPALLRELAGHDALFFTPLAEDTPRMIFDGYAAGLPLIGTEIPYVRARAEADGAVAVLPQGDVEAAAQALVRLEAEREALARLSALARTAAVMNCAEAWYARRAEWTLEVHARRLAEARD